MQKNIYTKVRISETCHYSFNFLLDLSYLHQSLSYYKVQTNLLAVKALYRNQERLFIIHYEHCKGFNLQNNKYLLRLYI